MDGGHPRREVCYRADHIRGAYEKKVILETEFAGYGGVGQGTIVDAPDGNGMASSSRTEGEWDECLPWSHALGKMDGLCLGMRMEMCLSR